MTDWIQHDSNDPPALAPAALVCYDIDDEPGDEGACRADQVDWRFYLKYRPLTDSEGIPYCSAEGLEPWAEYVATDEDVNVFQYEDKPSALISVGTWFAGGTTCNVIGDSNRHPGDWRESLMRVWRE